MRENFDLRGAQGPHRLCPPHRHFFHRQSSSAMSPTPPHPQAELSDSPSSPKRHRTILRSTLAFLGAIFRISFILSSLCVLAASAWTLHALLYPFSLFRRSQRELLKPGASPASSEGRS